MTNKGATFVVRHEIETLFLSFSYQIDTNCSWAGKGYLKEIETSLFFSLQESTSEEISISMCRSQVSLLETWNIKVFVKDRNGKSRHVQRTSVCGEKIDKHKIWKLPKKILFQELEEFLVNGEITFNIVLNDLNVLALHKDTIKEKCIQTSRQMDDVPCLDSLSLDLCNLMEDGSTSDVVLKSDNIEFPAHRAVLSSRSEIFSAMFRSDMREKREGFVEITDIDPSDLGHLLRYIYTGKVEDLTEDLARRLYVVADKYAVHSLKKKCVAFLMEILTDENACSTLILADTYNDSDLKTFIIDYIAERKYILQTEEWFRTADMHPKLGIEVFKSYIRKPEAVPNQTC